MLCAEKLYWHSHKLQVVAPHMQVCLDIHMYIYTCTYTFIFIYIHIPWSSSCVFKISLIMLSAVDARWT